MNPLIVSSAELSHRPVIRLGDLILCETCGESHPLRSGWGDTVHTSLWFYTCGDRSLLAGIDGRLLPGFELAEGSK